MKPQRLFRTIVLTLSLLVNITAQADGAQTPNPLFLEARSLWQQISASSINQETKAHYGKWFGDLAVEQKQLWSLAGQVDGGTCTGRCIDSYNNRIDSWQKKLESFNCHATTDIQEINSQLHDRSETDNGHGHASSSTGEVYHDQATWRNHQDDCK